MRTPPSGDSSAESPADNDNVKSKVLGAAGLSSTSSSLTPSGMAA